MDDREKRYEEYKKSVTGPLRWQMQEKKRSTVYSYTNVSGDSELKLILIGVLSGFALGASGYPESEIIRCILAAVSMIAFFYAGHVASEQRRQRGEDAFLNYRYGQLISDRVRRDRREAERKLLDDMQNRLDFLARFASPDVGDARNVSTFRQQRNLVEEYDTFEKWLQEDYHFSKAMHDAMK